MLIALSDKTTLLQIILFNADPPSEWITLAYKVNALPRTARRINDVRRAYYAQHAQIPP